MKKDRSDFRNGLIGKTPFHEIAFRINTNKEGHRTKQELIAIFWNCYSYYQLKFEKYFEEFNKIPIEVFEELIFEFRQSFPKHGRVEGVNYFDDLIHQLISKHNKHKKGGENSKRKPDIEKILRAKAILKEHPVLKPTQQKIFNTLKENKLDCSLSWIKKHYKEITS